jgi:hypothetical protein
MPHILSLKAKRKKVQHSTLASKLQRKLLVQNNLKYTSLQPQNIRIWELGCVSDMVS